MKEINGLKFEFVTELVYRNKVRLIKLFLDVELSDEQVEIIHKTVDRERANIDLQIKTPEEWATDIEKIDNKQVQCWVASVVWWHLSTKVGTEQWKVLCDRWGDCYEHTESLGNKELAAGLMAVGYTEGQAKDQASEVDGFFLQRVAEKMGTVKIVEAK